MRNPAARWATAAFLLFAVIGSGRVAQGDDFQPAGRWVLVNDWGWPLELTLFEVAPKEGGFEVRVLDGRRQMAVKDFVSRDGRVSFVLTRKTLKDCTFNGSLAVEGRYAGQVLGTTRDQHVDPCRLERTTADRLVDRELSPHQKQIDEAEGIADPRTRAAKLMEVVREHPGPETNMAFRTLLVFAERSGLTGEQVRGLIRAWFDAARPYGPAFVAESRMVVLRCLRDQPKFAPIALEVGEEARKGLNESSSADARSSLLHFLGSAARLSGHAATAVAAESEADAIDAKLDADYRAKVPPFKVDRDPGRKRSNGNRAVLLELFTGAMCAPCVAADVACDALDSTFATSELIVLQYHLPIPGADPLTNPDSLARKSYYEIRGVPTAIFNGLEFPGGGGAMTASEAKYRQYRHQVESLLAGKRSADIDLSVTRSADTLAIRVAASEVGNPPAAESRRRLRLALTEELVRYNGGNGIRLNHHVVRDLPGGVEGTPLQAGRNEVKLTLKLSEVRGRLQEYTNSIAPRLALVCPRPIPQPELKRLTLVAWIQDDATKQVLDAACVPVPDAVSP